MRLGKSEIKFINLNAITMAVIIAGAICLVLLLIFLLFLLLLSGWIIFQKAAQPGWAALVPVYNLIILLDIARKPRWWLLLLFIPIVNLAFVFIILHSISCNFGKTYLFTLGLIAMPIVFLPVLAFDDSLYERDIAG